MKKKYLILLLIILTAFFIAILSRYEVHKIKQGDEYLFVINKKQSAKTLKQNQQNELQKRAPIEIPDSSIVTLQNVKDTVKPTIVMFYVDWCSYCRRFMPFYGEVAREYSDKFNFSVVHCEKEENLDIVKEFKIHSFPSLFIIDKKVNYNFPLSGSVIQDKDSLKDELDKYLRLRKHFK